MTPKAGHTFTAGPWAFHTKHPQNACANIYADDGRTSIATCYSCYESKRDTETGIWGPQPIRDANARLIAAAPELLAALTFVRTDPCFALLGSVTKDEVHAALSKATAGGAV